MGYNTTVIVMNDALNEIEKDTQFGAKLAASIRKTSSFGEVTDVRAGFHGNAATSIETHHADVFKLISVGGNYARDLGQVGFSRGSDVPTELEMLKAWAERLGYRVSRKPER